jgi:hypothetical protein
MIKPEKLKKLETAYLLSGSLTNACKEVGISFETGKRYSEQFNWLEKRKKIMSAVDKKEVSIIAEIISKNLEIINSLKKEFIKAIKQFKINPRKLNIGDIDRLIRLEMYLLGDPTNEENKLLTNSQGITINVINPIPQLYPDLSEEEFLALQKPKFIRRKIDKNKIEGNDDKNDIKFDPKNN